MKALVLAAHPDDEVLGCGGTIARLAREGTEVHIAILGEGVTSRYPDRAAADRKLLAELKARTRTAARLLGVPPPTLFDLPDNRFDTLALLEVVKIVEGLIRRFRPDVVYTHHGADLNVDHCVVHRATLTATRPQGSMRVREVLAFEVPSSTDWAFGQLGSRFRANVFVDISQTLPAKVEAMEAYESEARAFPHPRSPKALQAMAQRWGSVAGVEAAEAFELIRSVRDAAAPADREKRGREAKGRK